MEPLLGDQVRDKLLYKAHLLRSSTTVVANPPEFIFWWGREHFAPAHPGSHLPPSTSHFVVSHLMKSPDLFNLVIFNDFLFYSTLFG